ncbi:MAG: hypothetical protein ABIO44_03170 [Saprospiraceae bacterium]
MRLLGNIPHPQLLISVFRSNTKIILKFEIGPFEQVYKFLETELIYDAASISKLIDETMLSKVFEIFDEMNVNYKSINEKK